MPPIKKRVKNNKSKRSKDNFYLSVSECDKRIELYEKAHDRVYRAYDIIAKMPNEPPPTRILKSELMDQFNIITQDMMKKIRLSEILYNHLIDKKEERYIKLKNSIDILYIIIEILQTEILRISKIILDSI